MYHRCNICNGVSIPEITTNIEDFKPGLMVGYDPLDNTRMICNECLDSVISSVYEMEEDDEITMGYLR